MPWKCLREQCVRGAARGPTSWASGAWPSPSSRPCEVLADAEAGGHKPHQLLTEAAEQRELDTARRPAPVLITRIQHVGRNPVRNSRAEATRLRSTQSIPAASSTASAQQRPPAQLPLRSEGAALGGSGCRGQSLHRGGQVGESEERPGLADRRLLLRIRPRQPSRSISTRVEVSAITAVRPVAKASNTGSRTWARGPVWAGSEVLPQHSGGPAAGEIGVVDQRVSDEGGSSAREMGGDGEPLLAAWCVDAGKARSVLVVAAGELHIVQDDPVVRPEQLGQRRRPREQIGLVDRAQPAGSRLLTRR